PSAEEGATIASWLSTGAMLINPTDSTHIRNVDSSKTRLCLLFFVAEIVRFHSRGDGDDSFPNSKAGKRFRSNDIRFVRRQSGPVMVMGPPCFNTSNQRPILALTSSTCSATCPA